MSADDLPQRRDRTSPISVTPPCDSEGVGTRDKHWEDLANRLAEAVEQVGSEMFLVLEYGDDETESSGPYAQMANTGGDPLCEIVSARHLAPDEWPLNELALQRDGWSPPYGGDFPNWWRFDLIEPEQIARGLLDGLRIGRTCTDSAAFRWRIGYFPGHPGDKDEIPEGADVLDLDSLAA